MIHDEAEVLGWLAQVAVALAGFSAVVVLFKRDDQGRWLRVHRDRFHGMVVHATAAVLFCMLPTFVSVFSTDRATIWNISSALLGVELAVQTTGIILMSTTSLAARLGVSLGYLFALLQVLNVAGIGYDHEARPYVGGVIWHVIQSGGLFVGLIWVPASGIDDD